MAGGWHIENKSSMIVWQFYECINAWVLKVFIFLSSDCVTWSEFFSIFFPQKILGKNISLVNILMWNTLIFLLQYFSSWLSLLNCWFCVTTYWFYLSISPHSEVCIRLVHPVKTMEGPNNFVKLSVMMKFSVCEEETGLFVVNAGFSHPHTELPHAFCGALLHSACIVDAGKSCQ